MKSLVILFSMLASLMAAQPAFATHVDVVGKYGSGSANCGEYNHSAEHKSVFMVGDSITAGGKSALLALKPRWEINAKPGRNVDCLTTIIRERLRDGYLGKVVIALGTNAVEQWTQADYNEVVSLIKARRPKATITFVTTYRDADIWTDDFDYRRRASVQYGVSKAMYAIAGSRSHVCLAKWRAYVSKREYLLYDGVHPTFNGKKAWARLVSNAVGNCNY